MTVLSYAVRLGHSDTTRDTSEYRTVVPRCGPGRRLGGTTMWIGLVLRPGTSGGIGASPWLSLIHI